MSDEEYSRTFKLLIVGDASVGKSALLMRFTDDMFSETYISTLGIDFKSRVVDINNERVRLQVWDSAGQERFRVNGWIKSIKDSIPDDSITIYLVANKIDLEEARAIPTESGEGVAKSFGVKYFETSAKTGENVDKVFIELGKDVQAKSGDSSKGNAGSKANGNDKSKGANAAEDSGKVELGQSNGGGAKQGKKCC